MKNDDKKSKMIQDHGIVLGKSHLEEKSGVIQGCWEGTIMYKFLKMCIGICNTFCRKEKKKMSSSFFHLEKYSHCSKVHKPSSTQIEIIVM